TCLSSLLSTSHSKFFEHFIRQSKTKKERVMSFASRLGCWLLALSLSLSGPVLAMSQPASSASAAQHSADEMALRATIEAFFNTRVTKDLDGFLRLWSKQSPEVEAQRKSTSELFAGSEKIELRGLTIRAAKIDGDKARVRVEADMQVIDAKTGKENHGFGKMLCTLECVKEEGNWKVLREASAFDELAAALAAAKSDQEREALQANDKELVTVELVRALSSQGSRFFGQGDYPQALAIYSLAHNIAEQIGDRLVIASALNNIGNVHHRQGRYLQSLEYLQKSLALSEALEDKAMIASALNNIGEVQRLQGNYGQALEYFQKSLAIREALGNQAGIARGL